MDKKIAGLLAAVAGLALTGSAQAAIPPAPDASQALQASSYGDLLAPIPNAVALMKADDAARAQTAQTPNSEPASDVQVAQFYRPFYHHHHHHHHHHSYYGYYRNYHHHHHHHHHRAFIRVPGFGRVVIGSGR